MFKLVIQDDEGKTTVVPLIRDEITIGRKEGNTIRLTERNVSRKHAKISRNNGAVAIEDLGSYNGVKVNGTRIMQKVTLNLSDRVQIGDYLIELKAEGAEQAAQASYEDAKTQPIERLDPATLGNLGLSPPPQPAAGMAPMAAPVAAPPSPARLVVLSSNFAGREFALTKSPMVIGRTDDNDIVINHRSISRNHAQIVRGDAGRYSVVDLQSANGVRVNGEDYGNVDLRRGDQIDLGHVRLRFVEPGEDFVFGRDAQVVDVPTAGGGSKKWLMGLIGLGVVGAIIALVVAGGGGGKKKPTATAGNGAGTQVAMGTGSDRVGSNPGSVMAAVPIDAAPEIDAPAMATGPGTAGTPAVDTAALDQALGAARAAVTASDWAMAKDNAQAALKIDGSNADAKAIVEQATREGEAENQFKAFTTAASAKEYDKAVKAFEKIPTDSVYKGQARSTYDLLQSAFIESRMPTARGLANRKDCKGLRRFAANSAVTFAAAQTEIERRVPCQEEVAVTPGSGPGSNPGTGPGTGAPEPAGGKTATELILEAQTAAAASQYGRALQLAEQAYKTKGASGAERGRAATLAGLSACNTKQAGKAKQYYALVSTSTQTLLRQKCLGQGIELAPP